MSKIRKCKAADLNTGQSKCQLDFSKVKGALIVLHGTKLPAELSATSLEEACHADRPNRVMPIFEFVEYATNGGEVQVSAVGYGPNQATGVSARTDTFTMSKFSEHLAAAVTKAMNTEYDVYFVDEKNNIYGINDGTDQLAGFPMSTIYHGGAPHPTSSAKATQTINFCHSDAQEAIESFDYIEAGFNVKRAAYGLVPVKFVEAGSGSKYKLVEVTGGYDRTAEFGATLASSASEVISGATALTYDAATETLTATGGVPVLKAPSALYTAGIKGIVQG